MCALRALHFYVLTCQRALCAYVLTSQRVLRAYVLLNQRALRAFYAYVPTFLGAITTNNKNKFSIICFPYIFVIILSFFFLLNKTVTHCCIALTRRMLLTGAMKNFPQA